MRRARQDERAALAALMFDQFYEKEELQQQFSGVDGQTARRFGPAVLSIGQGYYFTRGDVFVCDGANGTPIGAIVGADPRRLSRFGPLGQLLYALQNGKMLRSLRRSSGRTDGPCSRTPMCGARSRLRVMADAL